MKIEFNRKVLIIGCGAVSQCLQPLLLRHIALDFSQLTLIDPLDCNHLITSLKERGARFIQQAINQQNYASILATYLESGGLLIDLAVNLETGDLIEWCQTHNVLYINASVEWWDPYSEPHSKNILDRTLYVRHYALRQKAQKWSKEGATAIVEHGANPGLVSHWTKSALITIAQKILSLIQDKNRQRLLEYALNNNQFAQLAQLTGTKVIHIAERDMQITKQPKQVNEFVNTWSVDGFYEEATAPAELGWGTHERTLPKNAYTHKVGHRNQICLSQSGMNTLMKSWVPTGEIIGALIRHGEAFSISDYLTVWQQNQSLYRPTVHYVYLPADAAWSSLHEMKMNGYILQPAKRIMNDDIITGKDELGVLLLGHDLNGWWMGSHLSIEETRNLIGMGQNATTLQVAASILGALFWMIRHPRKGFCTPEQLPHEEILAVANLYLGTCSSIQTDWNPSKSNIPLFALFESNQPIQDELWQFDSFRITC